jgi:hypothetical protein
MKTIITFTFLLFSYLGFSQTTREEVVERNKDGQKLVVNTYTGTGNGEKLIKRTFYGNGDKRDILQQPKSIEYYGNYKYETIIESTGRKITENRYGCVKTKYFDGVGNLVSVAPLVCFTDDINCKITILP